MAEITKIQWTTHTFNPWRGCTKISAGCTNCYAERLSKRNPNVLGEWGPHGTRPLATDDYWRQPLKWNRQAEKAGEPAKVFCCSLADVFEDWDGQMTDGNGCPLWMDIDYEQPIATHSPHDTWRPYGLREARARLWDLIEQTPNLIWQLLTKRPENMLKMCPEHWIIEGWPPNVWAMTSVENQEMADHRVPELLKVPAKIRGLSVEPLLGPVDLEPYLFQTCCPWSDQEPCPAEAACQASDGMGVKIHWVIIGGESGPHARPCHVEWVRDLVRQCQAAGVACFVKQLGGNVRWMPAHGSSGQWQDHVRFDYERRGEASAHRIVLRDPKGGDPAEWPEDLRVREFP